MDIPEIAMIDITLAAILIILQFADWYTSHRALLSGKANEANPVMIWLIARVGFNQAFTIKGIFVAAMTSGLVAANAWWMLGALIAFYVYICVNNWRFG